MANEYFGREGSHLNNKWLYKQRNVVVNIFQNQKESGMIFHPVRRFLSAALMVVVSMALLGLAAPAQAGSGKIIGKVVDGETGEPLIGVSIVVQSTTLGAASNLDGNYLVKKLPPGTYTLQVSSIGYEAITIEEVAIKSGETANLDIVVTPKSVSTGKKIVVTAKYMRNTEATLLHDRQKSNVISDAISSEAFARSGSGDAAEAMTKVTGASVVGGKYIYIRGLGGRYSNSRLNGSLIPSPDPDIKAVPMDIFATNLLDNIVVEKTFTPDKPGSFSGGSVNLRTRDLPEELKLSFSASTSYNSNTSFNSDFLSAPRGSMDWLGYDDGTRDIPVILNNRDIPNLGYVSSDTMLAYTLDTLSKVLSNTMAPKPRRAPLNQSYAFSFGNNYALLGKPLGVVASLTYKHDYSFYDDGKTARWGLSSPGIPILTNDYMLNDTRGIEEILWGGMGKFSYTPAQNHKLNVHYVYNRQGRHEARYLEGQVPKDFEEPESYIYETRAIRYTEQTIGSMQFGGKHFFKPLLMEWKASFTGSERNEPDLRFFSNHYYKFERDDGTIGRTYLITPSLYPVPVHYFRDIEEDNSEGQLDFSLPMLRVAGRENKIKFGFSYLHNKRRVNENRYSIDWATSAPPNWTGDIDAFLSEDNMGLDTIEVFQFGSFNRVTVSFLNYLVNTTSPKNNYEGTEDVMAGYFMTELPLSSKLEAILGARLENTDMEISSLYLDTTTSDVGDGKIDSKNLLPAVSLVYHQTDNTNWRMAYGRTLARPTVRELSPLVSYEFVKGFLFVGNPSLNLTLIDNYDMRWELFPNPGEIVAISAFYKRFRDPIERVIINDNQNVQYQNVYRGTVYGAEFEFRKSLDFVGLRNFRLEGNLTLTHSEVKLPQAEYNSRLYYDSSASDTRPLQGQSPYIINLHLAYENPRSGTSITLLYNVFGDRLSDVQLGGTPDVYEKPRHMLDFTLTRSLFGGLNLKMTGKNILNSKVLKVIEYKGKDYTSEEHSTGTGLSLGLSYRFN